MSHASAAKPRKFNATPDYWLGVITPAVVPIMLLSLHLPALLVQSWVITVLWRYYLLSLGFGALSFSAAFGIALIVQVLLGPRFSGKDDRPRYAQYIAPIAGPLGFLFIGWVMAFFL